MKKGKNMKNGELETAKASGFETMRSRIYSAMDYNRKFLHNMAFQMRTSLNAIMGFSEILSTEDLSDDQISIASEINGASKSLSRLINDVIFLTAMDVNKDNVQMGSCSLGQVIEELRSVMDHDARSKGLELRITQTGNIPDMINTVPRYLRQCLTRLGKLTISFSQREYVCVKAQLMQDKFVRFEFSGGGIDLDEDARAHLFEPFAEDLHEIYSEFDDSGLGFAIVSRLAECINANLTVTDEPGNDVLFTLSVPVSASQNQPHSSKMVEDFIKAKENQSTGDIPKKTEGKPRILLAEDNPSNQTLVKILLTRIGCEVSTVSDGRGAVEKVDSEDFDVILMDMRMPNMTGDEAIDVIRGKGCQTPIVALTALDEEHIAQKLDADKINGCVYKPVDSNKLYEKISEFVQLPEKTHI